MGRGGRRPTANSNVSEHTCKYGYVQQVRHALDILPALKDREDVKKRTMREKDRQDCVVIERAIAVLNATDGGGLAPHVRQAD
jgi:hypothetical protein